jgi:nicotinate dehydrogenase subunit B
MKNEPETNRTLPEIEIERYEFRTGSHYRFDVDRREFFRVLGRGVLVLICAEAAMAQQESGGGRGGRGFGGFGATTTDINAFVHIGEDGKITAFTGKAEVGQNVRTSMTQAVAEELRVPVGAVTMVVGDTDLTPYDFGTFGSLSTPQMAPQLHRAAAVAREALLDLAADYFKADRSTLTINDGKVTHAGSTESATYGQLSKGQKLVKTVTGPAPVTPPKDWIIVGTSVPKIDGRNFVTGAHKYSSDINLPGMLHGKVLRATMFDATMSSLDTTTAAAMKDVTVVQDGNFVGVIAPDVLTAEKAVEAIKAEWNGTAKCSNADLFEYIRKNASAGGGGGRGGGRNKGSIETGMAAADVKLQQTYTIEHIAHIPLEPRAAVAQWKDDKVTIWTGSQRPFGIRSDVAQAFKLSDEQVHVIVPDTGSGYGGKHTSECAIEATRLARAAGKPVKVAWTRQEEFTWAYCRPAGVIDVSSGATRDGKITVWEFHDYHSGNSAINTPYDVPNQKTQMHELPPALHPLRVGSYRGLAGTANHFAREVHMDELAHELKIDPLEFRLKNCADARLQAVLETVAKTFGWGAKPAEGHGFGIAGGTEKGSYIACCAEVSTDKETGSVKVVRAVTVFECGAVRNPDQLKNQVEGALVMGLGGALFESLDFKDGMITNPFLADYRVPRFRDMPKIEVVLLDRRDITSAGAGETPIMAIAPATGNAIFDATGIRLRSMPLVPDGLNLSEARKG